MTSLFPDLLRAIITDIMLVLLLSTMATPKYKSKFLYIFVTTIILVGNVSADCYFYLTKKLGSDPTLAAASRAEPSSRP